MVETKIGFGILLGWVLTYFGFTQEMITIFAILMGIDFIFAIVAKWIYNPAIVESRMAVKGIVKKIGIFLLPFIVVIGGKVLGRLIGEDINFFFLASVCMGALIMQELYSIVRHIYNISTGEHLPEYEVATKIMEEISSFVKGTVEKKTDEIIEKNGFYDKKTNDKEKTTDKKQI